MIFLKTPRFLSLLLIFALLFAGSGCMKKDPDDPGNSDVNKNDTLVLAYDSDLFAEPLSAITGQYSKTTGKKLSAAKSGKSLYEDAKAGSAGFYVVDAHSDLSDFYENELFSDLSTDSRFLSTKLEIPNSLMLQNGKTGSYGVPLLLEAYGYIFDREVLQSLFEHENVTDLIDDLAACSYTDFEGFVVAVDTFIHAPSSAKVTVNGSDYRFSAEKTGKAANLTGVFSVSAESSRASEELLNVLLASRFNDRGEILDANEGGINTLAEVFPAYADVLDLHSTYIAGKDGSVSRGDTFIGGDFSYTAAIDLFTGGYALFYPGSTADASDFKKSVAGFGTALDIIPMKLPLSDKEITANGMSAEKLNRSIVVGARYYLAMNPKANDTDRKAMTDFIGWLYGNEAGNKAYGSVFDALPFNYSVTEPNAAAKSVMPISENGASGTDTTGDTAGDVGGNTAGSTTEMNEEKPSANYAIQNSLMASVARYFAKGDWIPAMTNALPSGWTSDVLGKNLNEYWGKEIWSGEDISAFTDRLLSGWTERI